jgi:uncharacterized protein GlcG (DUF336 family)
LSRLTLDDARVIVREALAEGSRRGARPLAVVVLDAGSWPLALERHEDASLFRADIASGKASAALGMGLGGRTLAARAKASPAFFQSLPTVTGGRFVPAAGGVLIRDDAGAIVGAVGVSGDTPDIDEACALAGIAEAGFSGDPGQE